MDESILQRVAVIGAAGKMGRGIAQLLLQEMALLEAAQTGAVGKGSYRLVLVDADEQAVFGLRSLFRPASSQPASTRHRHRPSTAWRRLVV